MSLLFYLRRRERNNALTNFSLIKTLLYESIENIRDEDFLLAVKQILDRKYAIAEQPVLSEKQINQIEESKLQIQKGNFLTNEQADELVEKWLTK